MTRTVEVRRGLYRDSVALMQMSHTVAGLPGVESALIAMATPLNLDLLPGLGFEPEAGTSPDDLLVAICADDDDALASALRRLEELFSARAVGGQAADVDAAAHDPERAEAKRRPSRRHLGPGPERVRRGDGCAAPGRRRDAVQRQRLRRAGDPAQGRGPRARAPGDGTRLRHGHRRRCRARFRQRHAARARGHRRRVRNGGPAGVCPPRRRGRRRERGARDRRSRSFHRRWRRGRRSTP